MGAPLSEAFDKKLQVRIGIGKIIWLSLVFGALYWVLDALFDSVVSGETTFMHSMVEPEPM